MAPLFGSSFQSVYGQTAPSNKVKVALIGCRSMGWSDLNTFLQYPEVECVALCDVDDEWLNKRAADVLKNTGKKVPSLYKDWRKVIDNKDVDVVIIGTPDHWHCLPMVYACQAGKDVYVEKPLANTIEECNLMEKAARKYNRIVQVGQWQRSDPHWDEAANFLKAGGIGRIRTVKVWAYQDNKPTLPVIPDSAVPAGVDYDMWLGPAPKRPFNTYRFHYNFRFFWDYAGGLMSDWGVHLLDYALEGMKADLPTSILASGGKFAYPTDAMETPDTLMATYAYKDFNIVWDHACGINHGLYDKKEGLAFYGENGTMVLTRAGWEVIPVVSNNKARMEAVPFKKGEGKGLYNHVGNMLSCIKSRELPNADVAIGAKVAKMSHLANISSRLGRGLVWDDAKSIFVNDPEATTFVKAYYRDPWKLPVL
ncbi:Inositol 2-dehydrogenase/D-chiro-inositol 3-dehydrogenase [bioreactor metagenome]|uniref:Inositol 2-dehydrogenase/D-chiro-inositol 3-dehydrogenase n=1 Tax=bioreactor metagenome TaxID=1076179 RepID=A0A644V290_9ZZZZ